MNKQPPKPELSSTDKQPKPPKGQSVSEKESACDPCEFEISVECSQETWFECLRQNSENSRDKTGKAYPYQITELNSGSCGEGKKLSAKVTKVYSP